MLIFFLYFSYVFVVITTCDVAEDGIGALPPEYIKVGRINMTIAKKAHIKAADVVVHPDDIEHIEEGHAEQLRSLGISVIDYLSIIVDNFNQVRKGSDGSILLVLTSPYKNLVLALRLMEEVDDERRLVWQVRTLYPADKFRKNQILLWER